MPSAGERGRTAGQAGSGHLVSSCRIVRDCDWDWLLGGGSPRKGRQQWAHLHAIYMCDHFDVLTFSMCMLKSRFLRLNLATATGPESWMQNGQEAQRGDCRVLVRVPWCSEQRGGWKGYFYQYPEYHLTTAITGKTVLLHVGLISFSILMYFIIYVIYYTDIQVHN